MNIKESVFEEKKIEDIRNKLNEEKKTQLQMMKEFGIDLIENPKSLSLKNKIKNACIKYDLKYLPLVRYRRLIPIENIKEIQKYKYSNPAADLKIIAPSDHFATENIKEIQKYKYSNPAADLKIIAPSEHFATTRLELKGDPIVLDDDTLVTSWGKAFTFLRRLKGIWMNCLTLKIIRRIIIASLVTLLFTPIYPLLKIIGTLLFSSLIAMGIFYMSGEIPPYNPSILYNTTQYPTKFWRIF